MMYSQLSPSQSKAQHSMVLTTKSPLSSSPTRGGLLKVEQAWLLPWHRLESSHSPNWPPPAPTVKLSTLPLGENAGENLAEFSFSL